MGRLIAADKLLEFMQDKCDYEAELDPIILAVVTGAIKRQPTAYDVDKVVAQLEEEKIKSLELFDGDSRHKGYCKAIEIVKAGGIDG